MERLITLNKTEKKRTIIFLNYYIKLLKKRRIDITMIWLCIVTYNYSDNMCKTFPKMANYDFDLLQKIEGIIKNSRPNPNSFVEIYNHPAYVRNTNLTCWWSWTGDNFIAKDNKEAYNVIIKEQKIKYLKLLKQSIKDNF